MAERKSFLLRIDPALWAEVERLAAVELRSTNGQVEWLLREALRRRRGAQQGGAQQGGAPRGEEAGGA